VCFNKSLAELMKNGWSWRSYGGSSGGGDPNGTLYLLEDEAGNQVYATLVGDEVVPITATANDIRAGKTAVTDDGIITGEKEIPAYHTTEGVQITPAGSACTIFIPDFNRYDYTKLQAIVCEFNSTITDSVAAQSVCIDDNVYAAGNTSSIAVVSLDHENKQIVLGITNETDKPLIIRYFTYKEEA